MCTEQKQKQLKTTFDNIHYLKSNAKSYNQCEG